jgi:hypothetical protein
MPEKFRKHRYSRLLTWMDKHCRGCGKFIKLHQRMYCSKCSHLNKLRINQKYRSRKYHSDLNYRKREIERVGYNRYLRNEKLKMVKSNE